MPDESERRKLNSNISSLLHRRLRIQAAKEDKLLQELVEEILLKGIEERERTNED